jgi:hypothetical protein
MRSYLITALAAGMLGTAYGLIHPVTTLGRVPFGEVFIFGLLPGLVCGVASLIILIVTRRRLVMLRNALAAIFAFILALGPWVGLADTKKLIARQEAEQLIHDLIPRLESYRNEHDTFPDSIAAVLPETQHMPAYFRIQQVYFSSGTNYSFSVVDSPRWPICSGVMAYHHASTNWDSCACW